MKFECAYTDNNGLKVSLVVSGVESFLQSAPEGGLSHLESSFPASVFERCLPEISQRLVEAHGAVAQGLLSSFSSRLVEEKDRLWGEIDPDAGSKEAA